MTQNDALDILKTGKNVFITGPAGSGKTYVVNQYIKYLKDHNVPIGITASTGIAATHLSGMTIHSWSGMGVKDTLDESELAELADKSLAARRVRDAKVLIIDEVSMLHHFRLDTLNDILRHVRKDNSPFGGIQVVLCGDFFQLPPVSKYGEPDTHFIYKSTAWRDGKFAICYLEENYRQGNDGITKILNEIRDGEVTADSRQLLRSRFRVGEQGEAYISYDDDYEPTRLYTHNIDVDSINDRELSRVESAEFTYEMKSRGKKNIVEALKRSCLAPEILRLKKGARVMCVKNNFDAGYVNGTLGTIISCGPDVDPIIRTASTPDYPEGRVIKIEPATWVIDDDGRIVAEIEQYPLRLAWAITVHKSQGMSLDYVEVDLRKSFEPGMGYVALSRVRRLDGLHIVGLNENALRVHPEVLEFDRHLRTASNTASRIMESFDRKDIVRAQEEFLAKVAPLHSIDKKEKKSKGRKSESAKISTYQKTADLIREKRSLSDIAKVRGVNEETIISHLEKVISGEERISEDLTVKDLLYLRKEISNAHFVKIEKALAESAEENEDDKAPLLSPIKNKLGPNVSWKEIRLSRLILGYISKLQTN